MQLIIEDRAGIPATTHLYISGSNNYFATAQLGTFCYRKISDSIYFQDGPKNIYAILRWSVSLTSVDWNCCNYQIEVKIRDRIAVFISKIGRNGHPFPVET